MIKEIYRVFLRVTHTELRQGHVISEMIEEGEVFQSESEKECIEYINNLSVENSEYYIRKFYIRG